MRESCFHTGRAGSQVVGSSFMLATKLVTGPMFQHPGWSVSLENLYLGVGWWEACFTIIYFSAMVNM